MSIEIPPPPTVILMPPALFGDVKSGGLSKGSWKEGLKALAISESVELKEWAPVVILNS